MEYAQSYILVCVVRASPARLFHILPGKKILYKINNLKYMSINIFLFFTNL